MVYPLIALFLGTGNQTANVSCAILERLFNDPNMKLWDYDQKTLLPNRPTMITFPKLHDFYEDWRKGLVSMGVDIRLQTNVAKIIRRDNKGIVLKTCALDTATSTCAGDVDESLLKTEFFDELVLCVLADDALRLLGQTATMSERWVLGGARFFDDITVTHSDSDYFNKHYETRFDEALCAEPTSQAQVDQILFARDDKRDVRAEAGGYKPMYYTKSYIADAKKIEMSFDCTNYQHQFRQASATHDYEHVYQTIFLDKNNKNMWTINEIDESKIIEKKWWHQLGHNWQHYIRVVPGMPLINGRNHTLFAGSWTLVVSNTRLHTFNLVLTFRRTCTKWPALVELRQLTDSAPPM